MAIKTFTAGTVLTAADTNTYLANSGLVYVTSVTIGSGVSSVTVDNCFTSTYDNYRIVVSGGGTGTNTDNLLLQLNLATGSSYYTAGFYIQWGTTTLNGYGPAATTAYRVGFVSPSTYSTVVDLINPNLAKGTFMTTAGPSWYGYANYGGVETGTSQHTGFTLSPGAGTITGGTITVYGYRKA